MQCKLPFLKITLSNYQGEISTLSLHVEGLVSSKIKLTMTETHHTTHHTQNLERHKDCVICINARYEISMYATTQQETIT